MITRTTRNEGMYIIWQTCMTISHNLFRKLIHGASIFYEEFGGHKFKGQATGMLVGHLPVMEKVKGSRQAANIL